MQGSLVTKSDSFRARRLTRRELIILLTAGAGFFSVAKASAGLLKAQFPKGAARHVSFPKGAITRTLLKDMSPAALDSGPILFHEHLSLNLRGLEEHFTDDVALMIEEVKAAGSEGISCIVDAGHADMGLRMAALQPIATESRMPIVASGGYYLKNTYPPESGAGTAHNMS